MRNILETRNFKDQYGPWAVVTGASSGIGEEFAEQLAAKGLNLVMLARRQDKMEALGKRLAKQHNIQYRTASVDLTDRAFIKIVEETTEGLDIGLLISNAGAGHMGEFLSLSAEDLTNKVHLNVTAHMQLSHYFANRMVTKGREGGILMVSSMAAFQGVPYMANYAAAKAYVLNFGEALNRELRPKGINVSVLVPGATETPMMDTMEANMDSFPMPFMPAQKVVQEGLHALEKHKTHHVPGLFYRVMSNLMSKRLLSRDAHVSMWGMMMKRSLTSDKA